MDIHFGDTTLAEAELAVLTPPGGHGLSPMVADSGMEWVQQRGTEMECSVREARSQAPTGPAQCRATGGNRHASLGRRGKKAKGSRARVALLRETTVRFL